jgi:hypothetical protein
VAARSRTVTNAPSLDRDSLPDLLLVRLLPVTNRPPTLRAAMRDVARFLRRAPTLPAAADVVERLRLAELVERRHLALTASGRDRALQLLGVASLPPGTTWRAIRTRWLPAAALGVPPEGVQGLDEDRLSGLLLARTLGLPDAAGGSARAALEALVCRELGVPDATSLEELFGAVLARRIGADAPPPAPVAARVLLDVARAGPAPLRERLVADWLAPRRGAVDLPSFAAAVRAAARDSETGWFGDHKVFVSHVWERARSRPELHGMDLDAFKRQIVEANARGLVSLSKADLVHLMDPRDVKRSETHGRNAVFHFVRVE